MSLPRLGTHQCGNGCTLVCCGMCILCRPHPLLMNTFFSPWKTPTAVLSGILTCGKIVTCLFLHVLLWLMCSFDFS